LTVTLFALFGEVLTWEIGPSARGSYEGLRKSINRALNRY